MGTKEYEQRCSKGVNLNGAMQSCSRHTCRCWKGLSRGCSWTVETEGSAARAGATAAVCPGNAIHCQAHLDACPGCSFSLHNAPNLILWVCIHKSEFCVICCRQAAHECQSCWHLIAITLPARPAPGILGVCCGFLLGHASCCWLQCLQASGARRNSCFQAPQREGRQSQNAAMCLRWQPDTSGSLDIEQHTRDQVAYKLQVLALQAYLGELPDCQQVGQQVVRQAEVAVQRRRRPPQAGRGLLLALPLPQRLRRCRRPRRTRCLLLLTPPRPLVSPLLVCCL
jgi:hypothetical protein